MAHWLTITDKKTKNYKNSFFSPYHILLRNKSKIIFLAILSASVCLGIDSRSLWKWGAEPHSYCYSLNWSVDNKSTVSYLRFFEGEIILFSASNWIIQCTFMKHLLLPYFSIYLFPGFPLIR